ncbi:MAG: SpoIIE family protein phosphatase [Crocinitomicaceae bacterium]|nr:SpoIIE family protein phosphatase [Crocinitomicaceae bacterium]MBK8926325.1 SpoIIE family protein phosphatase [Crocinitomicaceae bacterium]
MRILSLIISLILLSASAAAQQFHLKKYGLEEGLPRVGVYDILQDDHGFLWIGTEGGGVCTFDGYKFHSYTRRNGLTSDNVRLIFQASDKTIWVATDEGVCYFNGTDFIKVSLSDSLDEDRIRSIHEDDNGKIWVGSDHGISFIHADKKLADTSFSFQQNFSDSTVRCLTWYQNKMWVGTDSGLYWYDKQNGLSLFPMQNNLCSWSILKVFPDSKGNIWIGTDQGVNKISDSIITVFTTKDGLINNRVRSIAEDQYGNIWFGTSRGISVYDYGEMINLTMANGLTNDRVRCLTTDSFGNMWVGTFFGGIMRYNPKDFIGFTTTEGLASNQIQALCEDEYGDVLVGTNAGLTYLEVIDNKLYNYSTLTLGDNYLGNSIRAVYYDENGYVWLGNARGITIIKNDYKKELVFVNSEDGSTNVTVTAIKKYHGKYYVGTNSGLFQVNVDEQYQFFEIINLSENNQMGGKEVSSIAKDYNDRIWFGFSDGTISVLDQAKLITPAVPENLENVLTIAIDSTGNLWFGTNGNGLFTGTYDASKRKLNLKNYSTLEQLSSNYIYSILVTDDKIWLGHEHGIDILLKSADSVSTIIHCGKEIGFAGLQNNTGAALLDSKGNIWFGTMNGLYRLNTKELSSFTDGTPSIVYLTGLMVNEQFVDWKNSEWCDTTWGMYDLPVNLNLPYNKNNLSFEFLGINFIAPEKIKFSWKLEGFDDDWSAPSSFLQAQYTNLPAGIYTFKVRASNELGVIQDTYESITFIIEKPFWETWGFRIAAGVFITLLVLMFLRWRTKQLRENQRKLEAIIAERTQEITSQKEMLEEKNKEVTDSIFYSRRIQRSILPAKEKVAKLIEKYFIFFRPKDIVSGDFYWADRSLDKSKTFFAVADCTGHGVPGAMVSLIGVRALTSALRESGITVASEILDNVNESVIETFTDHSTNTIIKDGMDIALCSLDYSNNSSIHFQYAGAHNSVWIVRTELDENILIDGEVYEPNLVYAGYKLFEIKADKQPIGYFDGRKAFSNHTGVLKNGDRIYLYSDGFADQFGGEKGKKFKYKTLKELILSAQEHTVEEQYTIIRNAFYDWKREFEQIDDVCLMGVEV